jgi:anti-sigma factor RsiW
MNCAECQDVIHASQGDELEEQLLAETEAHLANCPDCRHEAAELLASLNRLRAAFPDQRPPAALLEKIQAHTMTQETI